jgi:hypothetical protein
LNTTVGNPKDTVGNGSVGNGVGLDATGNVGNEAALRSVAVGRIEFSAGIVAAGLPVGGASGSLGVHAKSVEQNARQRNALTMFFILTVPDISTKLQ